MRSRQAGTTSSADEPGSPRRRRSGRWTRAISGAASRAMCSKSSAVTARSRVRSRIGSAHLGPFDSLAVDTALTGTTVVDAADIGDRCLQHGQGARGDIAARSATSAINGHAHVRALGRHHPVIPQRAVRETNGRPEFDVAAHRVDHEVAVVRAAGGEVGPLGPFGPVVGRPVDLDDERGVAGDDRRVLQLAVLAGNAFGRAKELLRTSRR